MFINPITVTDVMLGAGTTIAEPSAGETLWSGSGVAYAVGDEVIRAETHRIYKCAVAHTSASTPTPENDPTRWVDLEKPTQRWAPFDIYTNTATLTTTSLTYVITPGVYFNSIAMYLLTGSQYSITVKSESGGSVIFNESGFLFEPPIGWYEYLFEEPRSINKIFVKDLPLSPTAELTISITAASGQPVGVGMITIGDYITLKDPNSSFGGILHGASVEPMTYSYIKTESDGTTRFKRRNSATDLKMTVIIPTSYADVALEILNRILDTPVAWVISNNSGYRALSTFGYSRSSPIVISNKTISEITLNIKGII